MQYNPLETYLQEADDLLAEIEQAALSLDSGERTGETIHQLFRAFHTIKGSGAMCGLDAVAGFTHHLESLLDRVRVGAIPVSPALSGLVLKARDHIKLLLGAEQGGAVVPAGLGEALIAAIGAMANPLPQPGAEQAWSIVFHPNPILLARGGNPVALLRELGTLGACEVTAHTDEIPALDEIQPDLCYLHWTIRLHSSCDQNAIRDVFIFVEDDSRLEISKLESDSVPEPEPQAGGSVASDAGSEPPVRPKAIARESTVRVPSNRLDCLVNLVGELVMNQSRLAQAASEMALRSLPIRCRNWSGWSPNCGTTCSASGCCRSALFLAVLDGWCTTSRRNSARRRTW